MKNKVYAFLALMLFALMVVPFVNLISGKASSKPLGVKWWDSSILYNVDFMLPVLGRIYYLLGISIDSEQVLIGRDGWLYLGDQYSRSITVKRVGATIKDEALLDKVVYSAKAWEKLFKENGVKEYRIIIGPDKDSIYPEYLPGWAEHAVFSVTDAMMRRMDGDLFINTTQALRRGKSEFDEPLYYKTDTHWNALGAWVAFNQFSENLARTQPEIIWPKKQTGSSLRITHRPAGDLANFQRIRGYLTDSEVVMEDFSKNPIPVEQYDYATGKLLVSGGNSTIGAPNSPLLVKSKKALNHKKVLWLRDSFGLAMAPFMAATFDETLQLHHVYAKPELLVDLVKKYKPDYVFVTVVERVAREGYFQSLPPMSIAGSRDQFIATVQGTKLSANHLSAMADNNSYQVNGTDPFIMFKLSRSVQPKEASRIVFELNCNNGEDKVPVQLFWRTKSTNFNEASSVHFLANQGITSIDLSMNPDWTKNEEIVNLRLDLAAPTGCPIVSIRNLELGMNQVSSILN